MNWRAADDWWNKYPIPATQAELEKLAALYGLCFGYETNSTGTGFVRLSTAEGAPLSTFLAISPIERYIARIAEWRKTGS